MMPLPIDDAEKAKLLDRALLLVMGEECTPACLFGLDNRECSCRCGGVYHAELMRVGLRSFGEGVPLAACLADCCPVCWEAVEPSVVRDVDGSGWSTSHRHCGKRWDVAYWSYRILEDFFGLTRQDVTGLPKRGGMVVSAG